MAALAAPTPALSRGCQYPLPCARPLHPPFSGIAGTRTLRPASRGSRSRVAAAPGPPPPTPPASDSLIKATGVPLVDEFCNLPSVSEALIQGVQILVVTTVACFLAGIVLAAISRWLGEDEDGAAHRFPTLRAALRSVTRPAARLLPAWWLLHSLTTVSALGQVAGSRRWAELNRLTWGNGAPALALLRFTSQFFQDLTQMVVIVGVAWAVTIFKDRVVTWVQGLIRGDPGQDSALCRLIRPASTLLGWGIYGAAAFATLQNFGVNIQPLLASVGASSVIIGLAAQSTLKNFTGAIMLYTSQPFTAGDKVQLLTTGGGKVIEGVVQSIEPSRTVIRVEDGSPVYIANADILNYLVKNLSRSNHPVSKGGVLV
ncbi:MSC1 [Auxenochlorella protothecoides x Auxenochlorella symbiontica]|uniref:Mechanosensitive ion channel MscS domain-containing protein n=1 Tax=Auxenochlorella protothecoides TaxID=3075 RepID=A0A1D2A5U1_AUXPR